MPPERGHKKEKEPEYNEAMRKKNTYKPEFKSKVVIELLTG
jgi:hypothetical protein